jgi:hypothetical protein
LAVDQIHFNSLPCPEIVGYRGCINIGYYLYGSNISGPRPPHPRSAAVKKLFCQDFNPPFNLTKQYFLSDIHLLIELPKNDLLYINPGLFSLTMIV